MPKEVNVDEKKDQLLNEALKQIEKQYGKGSIMKLGDRGNVDIDVISTGSLAIDNCLGVGGLPRGRIIEIYGPESSGKTTLALQAIASCQKDGGRAAFIDAEHAIDPKYAKALGVDIDELILSQPDSGEQALEITEVLIKSGAIDLIVIDSVAALVPQAELDGEMGDANVGLHARLMSKAMRKLAGAMNANNCTTIFINQLREKMNKVKAIIRNIKITKILVDFGNTILNNVVIITINTPKANIFPLLNLLSTSIHLFQQHTHNISRKKLLNIIHKKVLNILPNLHQLPSIPS